jgi:hypothetical protein
MKRGVSTQSIENKPQEDKLKVKNIYHKEKQPSLYWSKGSCSDGQGNKS